jgi:hypothetical protein
LSDQRASFALALVITAAVFAAGFSRIADLDFWWHLQTGKVIVSTHEIPRQDIYSFTARGHEYIDHEWLFQILIFIIYSHFGPVGIAIAKCLVISATFVIAALYAVRRGAPPIAVGGITLLAIAGGITRFIERPEVFSTLFAVLTYVLLDRHDRTGDRRPLLALPLLCALWANIHAAVIVGLVIQVLFIIGGQAPSPVPPSRQARAPVLHLVLTLLASVLATGLNPYGYRVLLVPFELTRIINSGVLNNEEWRNPTFIKTPFFFVALLLTVIALIRPFRPVNVLIGAFLAYVSLRYIRNVGLFCAFVPILTAPSLAQFRKAWTAITAPLGAVALAVVLAIYFPFQRGVGEASYFPDGLVRYTREKDLRGNMLNSYGFGGYLIWTLWPERLIFIDGRNEVFLPLLQRLAVARRDSRAWNALLIDYTIEYALVDYIDELERVTSIGADGKTTTTLVPVTNTRFPRSRWALVHWDDDGMIFVKRNGVNAQATEYTAIYPEGRGYQKLMIESGAVDRSLVLAELQRKLLEDPQSRRARALLQSIQVAPASSRP